MKIKEKYVNTEKQLLQKFRESSQHNDVEQMQRLADTLSRTISIFLDSLGN